MIDISLSYVNLLNDSKVNEYLEVRHKKQNIDTVYNYINNLRKKSNCDLFGIYFKKSKQIIGTLGISNFDKNNKRVEYGLLVGDAKARNFGVGVLATILFYEYIFSMYDIIKIHNPVVEENKSAWKLVESLGSLREGTLRNHFISSSGRINNMFLYGLTKEDWIDSKKKIPQVNLDLKISEILNKD